MRKGLWPQRRAIQQTQPLAVGSLQPGLQAPSGLTAKGHPRHSGAGLQQREGVDVGSTGQLQRPRWCQRVQLSQQSDGHPGRRPPQIAAHGTSIELP